LKTLAKTTTEILPPSVGSATTISSQGEGFLRAQMLICLHSDNVAYGCIKRRGDLAQVTSTKLLDVEPGLYWVGWPSAGI